jgi:hypothetical protein
MLMEEEAGHESIDHRVRKSVGPKIQRGDPFGSSSPRAGRTFLGTDASFLGTDASFLGTDLDRSGRSTSRI